MRGGGWTRADELVAAEIASAVLAGRTISARQIVTITGLTRDAVVASVRKLGEAGLIKIAEGVSGSGR